jgi:RNA polymerase sigma-54 factor
MRLETSLQQRLEQRLAPQIIQSIEILQLAAIDLQELIKQELSENEVLEEVTDITESSKAQADQRAEAETREIEQTFERLENLDEWNDYSGPSRQYSGSEDGEEKDRKLEAMQNTASRPESLQDFLFKQFNLLEIEMTPEVRGAAEQIIYNIDANGYLQYPLEELVENCGGKFTIEQAQEALGVVQSLEPRGIGGRSAQECLILQLDKDDPLYEKKKLLLERHLDDIWKNKLPKIARDTGDPIEAIKELVLSIAELNPRPGSEHIAEQTHYIKPDVIVEWVDGRYEVRLEDSFFPTLRISPRYRKLFESAKADAKVREYIKKKIESAKWLIESIQQRQNTLSKVCNAIIKYQTDFLDYGTHHLRPLKMQRIADEVGLHVSTVSRAIADKHMQTHRGILPIKFFFTGGTETADGNEESRTSVRQRVKEIIEKEDRSTPLSDDEIADKLQKELGLQIARRTVTKYRKALRIPSSRQRRVY